MDKVVAVVVTYNRINLLKEVINNLLAIHNLDILVINNASTDETDSYLNSISNHHLIYYNLKENIGGAGGFNLGIRKALDLNPNYIWLMDDDCIADEQSLTSLLFEAKKLGNFGFLASKVLWTDGSLCKMNIPRINLYKEVKDESVQRIRLASFCSLFINVESIYELGLPYKEFFIWGDDWEYTYRISKKFPSYYIPNSVVIHKINQNSGLNIVNDNNRLDRYFYAYRNERFFYNRTSIFGKIYGRLKSSYHKLKLLYLKKEERLKKYSIIREALKAEKSFKPKVEYYFPLNKKINVATFFAEPISYGGQESFMKNMYLAFEDYNIKHYCVTPFNKTNEMFNFLNVEIVTYNYSFDSKLRKYYIKKSIKKFLEKYHIDVIHIQSGSLYALYKISKLAHKYGVKLVIVHSHAGGINNFKYRTIKRISDKKINRYTNKYLACSKEAAIWKFPNYIINDSNYKIIKNGIMLSNYKFDPIIREQYRNEFFKYNSLILLNVARLEEQKNQLFILSLCETLNKQSLDFKCYIIGEGTLKQSLQDRIKESNLDDKVILLNNRTDINNIMFAADIFLMPSIFEGLPMTLVEAQCSGLFCLVSDTVSKECSITNNIRFLSYTDLKPWINSVKDFKCNDVSRKEYVKIVNDSGFNAIDSAKMLENIYRGKE